MKPTENASQAKEFLLKNCPPGTKVYTLVTHVSRSGMTRRILPFIIVNNEPVSIAWHIHQIGLFPRKYPNDDLTVQGCGMDMTFHVVYELGRYLYPQGFKLAKGQYGRNGDTSGYDKDGGYALTNVHF
jgi:hypothetical protein